MDQRQETLQRGRRWGRIAPPSYPAAFPLYRAVSRRQKAWIAAASDRKWEIVLQSGRKWGTVAPSNHDRSGGAPPPPPLRSELCPRGKLAFRGHFEHSLDAKNRLSIPA